MTYHVADFSAAAGEEPDDVSAATILELVGSSANRLAAFDVLNGVGIQSWLGDRLGHGNSNCSSHKGDEPGNCLHDAGLQMMLWKLDERMSALDESEKLVVDLSCWFLVLVLIVAALHRVELYTEVC
jgi:hypothetical protein